MGNLTDWPIQHNRSGRSGGELYRGAFGGRFCRFACGL